MALKAVQSMSEPSFHLAFGLMSYCTTIGSLLTSFMSVRKSGFTLIGEPLTWSVMSRLGWYQLHSSDM